jgi:hypothetical protein
MDLISIIIFIVIVVSKFAGKNEGSRKRPNGHPFSDLERTFKQAKKLMDEYVQPTEKAHDVKHIQNKRNLQEEPNFKSLDNINNELSDENTDTVDNVTFNKEPLEYEATIVRNDELKIQTEPEENIGNEMDYNSYYDLSISKEDMVKAIIFSEILDKPLCKRDAR